MQAAPASDPRRRSRPPWPDPDRSDALLWATLVLVILTPHLIDLSGWLSSNPVYFVSGLGDGTLPGPLPGFPGWIDFHAGATTQALGRLDAEDWLRGVAPWWNPYAGVGLPLAGQFQSGPLFLPFVLLQRCFDGVTYLKVAMQLIAGLATLALLRRLGLGRVAALAGAALYGLGGNFAWFGDAPIMPAPFLPLLLLGIERARLAASLGRPGGSDVIAVAMAYLLLAGFPETAYFSGLLALCWSILRMATATGHRVAFGAKVVLGGSTGLLIAAPGLWAFFHYLGWSWDMPRYYAHAALAPANYAQYIFPYVMGPIHYRNQFDVWFHIGGFVGTAPLFLALAGALHSGRERGLRRLLAAWVIVCLAKSADMPGITSLVDAIPFVPVTLFFRYIPATFILALAILTGFAIDDLARGDWRFPRRRVLAALAAYGVLAVVSLGLAWPQLRILRAAGGSMLYPVLSVGAGVALAAALAWLCLRPGRAALVAGLAVAEAVALFAVPLLSGTPKGVLHLGPVDFLHQHLGLQRIMSVGPIVANYSAYFGVRAINFNYLPVAKEWAEYAAAHVNPSPILYLFNGSTPDSETQFRVIRKDITAFTALGVKYLIARRGTDPYGGDAGAAAAQHVGVAYQDELYVIYELPDPAPYVAADGCTLSRVGPTEVEGTCPHPADLIRRELFFPGWTATLNGQDAPIERQQPLFQRVALPTGPFAVQFRYAPPHIAIAYGLFGLGIVLLVGNAWISRSRGSPASG